MMQGVNAFLLVLAAIFPIVNPGLRSSSDLDARRSAASAWKAPRNALSFSSALFWAATLSAAAPRSRCRSGNRALAPILFSRPRQDCHAALAIDAAQ